MNRGADVALILAGFPRFAQKSIFSCLIEWHFHLAVTGWQNYKINSTQLPALRGDLSNAIVKKGHAPVSVGGSARFVERTPSLDSRVRLNEDVVFQELEGEAVLLNPKTGIYFGLDPVGTRIWNFLQGDALLSNVVAALCDEFDVAEARCAEDVLHLVAEMEKNSLVTID